MTIISFVSAKGGTGKTSIAASTATVLSHLNLKTLLIDLDYATNGLTLLFLDKISKVVELKGQNKDELRGILEISEEPGERDVRITNVGENLDLLPSTYSYQV